MSEPVNRERDIFNEALEIESPEARSEYLERACGADHELRERVEALLKAYEAAAGFIPDRAPSADEDLDFAGPVRLVEKPGDLIGRYKLLEKIGEGGMGVVYLAEQWEPVRRQVALKIIKVGMDTRQVVARFEAERQALALMDHPNIAKVLDGGETSSGRPYFVMELVSGIPITRFCDQERLDTKQRLELFTQVCSAVQHAHQKGVIHRDLKPSNVLVAMGEGEPMPKIIDFGLAKSTQEPLTKRTLITRSSQFIGTPAYMSPEQAKLGGGDVDTRTDIYSLGVLLYELLTGKLPFDTEALLKAGYEEILRIIREVEPQTPSRRLSTLQGEELTTAAEQRRADPRKLGLLVRGDLDWIVMKALEKDRERRYGTPNDFASDIRRHLSNEPIIARPQSKGYRLQKAVQRNKLAFAAATVVASSLVVGAVVSLWQAGRATRAERRAQEEARFTQEALNREAQARNEQSRLAYARTIALAQRSLSDGFVDRTEELLGSCPTDLRGWEYHYLERLCNSESISYTGHVRCAGSVAFSPDGLTVASAGPSELHLWDRQTGRALRQLQATRGWTVAAFSPDGMRLASATFEAVELWDLSSGAKLKTFCAHPKLVMSVAFSPDGKFLVTAGAREQDEQRHNSHYRPGAVKIWDSESGDLIREIPTELWANSAEFSPDGRFIAGGTGELSIIGPVKPRELKAWEVASGKEVRNLSGHTSWITSVAFSADGKWLAAGSSDRCARLWDLNTGQMLRVFVGHRGQVNRVLFTPDSKHLVTSSDDESVRMWNIETGRSVRTYLGMIGEVSGLAISRDGQWLAAASHKQVHDQGDKPRLIGTVKIWDATQDPSARVLERFDADVTWLAFSDDGAYLAATLETPYVVKKENVVYDLRTERIVNRLKPSDFGPSDLAFQPGGHLLSFINGQYEVVLWDVETGRTNRVLDLSNLGFSGNLGQSPTRGFVWDPSGKRLYMRRLVWDLERNEVALRFAGHKLQMCLTGLSVSPDGKRLASANWGGYYSSADDPTTHKAANEVKIWNSQSGAEIMTLDGGGHGVVYSPNGRFLVSGESEGRIRVWDAASGKLVHTMHGHGGTITSVAITLDGKRLASSDALGIIKVWDLESGNELLVLEGHTESVKDIKFSPDGHTLASAGADGTIRLWEAAPLAPSTGAK